MNSRERRDRHQAAVAAALEHFEATTGQVAHRSGSDVIGEDARGVLVRVCYGSSRPPGRAWFAVGGDGSVNAELTYAEAAAFGERPWR